MNLEDLKKGYGPEYPTAMIVGGIRIPLTKETRFSRSYRSEESNTTHCISRFMDGSASISFSELAREWGDWTEETKMDFCQNCNWLFEQADFPDMLRYILKHGSEYHWSGIAMSVASYLPQQEAFDGLVQVLHGMKLGRTANISQGISITKHPNAESTLREHLAKLWKHPKLWDDDDFQNWIAFDAITCIAHLLELNAAPEVFDGQVRRLSEHICEGSRKSCRVFLSKHYSWLK
jgi:hypothetical protein